VVDDAAFAMQLGSKLAGSRKPAPRRRLP
jgi:hypothetical protein